MGVPPNHVEFDRLSLETYGDLGFPIFWNRAKIDWKSWQRKTPYARLQKPEAWPMFIIRQQHVQQMI